MKKLKKIISLLTVLALCLSARMVPSSFAETEEDYLPKLDLNASLEKARAFLATLEGKTDEEIAAEKGISPWDVWSPYGTSAPKDPPLVVTPEQSWDDVVASLFEKYEIYEKDLGLTKNITLGYYNTVTGEEHYYGEDQYLVSASMFKIPLNMIVADKIHNGELTWDTEISGFTLGYLQYKSIVQSDNERAMTLMNYLGGYSLFKGLQIPYLGEGADPITDLGWTYQTDNFYTPRQICSCLKMLYDEPDRFAGIVENMLEAEPFKYFRQYERRYPIAQKYGFVEQNEMYGVHSYVNDCAIVYSDMPFIIVMFTDNIPQGYDVMGEYAVLMTDYTNFRLDEKRAEDERAAEQLARQQAEEQARREAEAKAKEELELARQAETDAAAAGANAERGGFRNFDDKGFFGMTVTDLILFVVIAAAMLFCMVLIFRKNGAGGINGFWGVISILFAGAAFGCCIVGARLGTLYARVEADPQETVNTFYKSVLSGEYEKGYACLQDYSSLGIENMPSAPESRMLYEALKNSYSYALRGEPQINMLTAKQRVAFVYLSLDAIEKDAASRVEPILKQFVDSRSRSELYDENGAYLTSLTDEIYIKALSQAIDHADQYYTSVEYDVDLTYSDGKWLINVNPEMLNSFLGGIS